MTSFSKFSFLRRVRIHDGECGAVARALHHEVKSFSLPAAFEKVSLATKERKVMSKKTFFKRIALTAVAALGFSMTVATPSNAIVLSNTISIDSATDAIFTNETATAVITHAFVNEVALDSVTIRAIQTSGATSSAGTIRLYVSDSSTNVSGDEPAYNSAGNRGGSTEFPSLFNQPTCNGGSAGRISLDPKWGCDAIDSFTVSNDNAGTSVRTTISARYVAPSAPGTYVVTFYTSQLNLGTAGVAGNSVTWTITVTNRDTKADASSVSVLRTYGGDITSGNNPEQTDSSTLSTTGDAGVAPAFTLFTKLKNTAGTSLASTARESITVVATGEAYISTDATATNTQNKTVTMSTDAAPDADGTPVYIWSTGTAGTATIKVTALSSGLTWEKSVTFAGDVVKLEVTNSRYKIARTGGNETAGMFRVTATDAAGTKVIGLGTLSIVSSNTAAVATGSCTDAGDLVVDGVYSCNVTSAAGSVSGAKSTLTVRTDDPASTDPTKFITTTYDVSLGGGVASVVLSTNKATYEPGEAMVITATAKDASGNPVYDGLSGPTLSVNKSVGGSLTMNVYVGGVSTSQTRTSSTGVVTSANTLFAPAASGKFRVSGLAGDAASTPISVEATVSDDQATAAASAATDAALEAIDAANAATDAANLAAEAADAATVAAEEARDAADAATAAVEALATEVATLMAALKAQITTLANTVAKIAKKVKA